MFIDLPSAGLNVIEDPKQLILKLEAAGWTGATLHKALGLNIEEYDAFKDGSKVPSYGMQIHIRDFFVDWFLNN